MDFAGTLRWPSSLLFSVQMMEDRSLPTWEASALCLLIFQSGKDMPLEGTRCRMARRQNFQYCSRERACLFLNWRNSSFRYEQWWDDFQGVSDTALLDVKWEVIGELNEKGDLTFERCLKGVGPKECTFNLQYLFNTSLFVLSIYRLSTIIRSWL